MRDCETEAPAHSLRAVGDAESTRKERVLTRRQNEGRHLRGQIDSLKASLCWRITDPLRSVGADREPCHHDGTPGSERRKDATGETDQSATHGDTLVSKLDREIEVEEAKIRRLEMELRRLKSSSSWRITAPIRWLNQTPRKCAELLSDFWDLSASCILRFQLSAKRWKSSLSSSRQPRERIVYISGEPGMPGHTYRVEMPAAALSRRGSEVHTDSDRTLDAISPLARSRGCGGDLAGGLV